MNILTFNHIVDSEILFETDSNGREIRIYNVSECIATGMNMFYPNVLLYHNDRLTLPVIERTMSLQSGTIYEKMNMQFEYHQRDYIMYMKHLYFFLFIIQIIIFIMYMTQYRI